MANINLGKKYEEDISTIYGVQFGILSPEEIMRRSVVSLTESTLYDSNRLITEDQNDVGFILGSYDNQVNISLQFRTEPEKSAILKYIAEKANQGDATTQNKTAMSNNSKI